LVEKEFVDYVGLMQGRDLKEFQDGMSNMLERREAYVNWIAGARIWTSFVTLTVDTKRLNFDISQESMTKKVMSLFHFMNLDLVGKRYKRVCGPHYFSWVTTVEPHKSGNMHAHFIADRPLNSDLIERTWHALAGFSSIKIIDDMAGAVRYVSKDLVKTDGYLDQYFRRSLFTPYIKPYWWIDNDVDHFRGTNSGAASVPQEVIQGELWLNNEK
jgi:hypothetical protein